MEAVIYVKKPEVSLLSYEIVLKNLSLYLHRSKILEINSKRSTRFSVLAELATVQIATLFSLYTQAMEWHMQQQSLIS